MLCKVLMSLLFMRQGCYACSQVSFDPRSRRCYWSFGRIDWSRRQSAVGVGTILAQDGASGAVVAVGGAIGAQGGAMGAQGGVTRAVQGVIGAFVVVSKVV
jgi:hypothetical protein